MALKPPDSSRYDKALKRLQICEAEMDNLEDSRDGLRDEIDKLKDLVTRLELDLHNAYKAADESLIEDIEQQIDAEKKRIHRKEQIILVAGAGNDEIFREHERQIMRAEVVAGDAWRQLLRDYQTICMDDAIKRVGEQIKQAFRAHCASAGRQVSAFNNNPEFNQYVARELVARLADQEKLPD